VQSGTPLVQIGLQLSTTDLENIVRRGIHLPATTQMTLSEVSRWSNLNYVFRVEMHDRVIYLKAAAPTLKNVPIRLPAERIIYEAASISRFGAVCGPTVIVPEVLFVDKETYVIGISDVGSGKQVLLEVLDQQYDLLLGQVTAFAIGLGNIHKGTRHNTSLRPPIHDKILRTVLYNTFLTPGAMKLFPDRWLEIRKQMISTTECLVHCDLWAKNLLVKKGSPISIVDYEGVSVGDPAFDVGTVLALSLIPAIRQRRLWVQCFDFNRLFISEYALALRDASWAASILSRAFFYVGVFRVGPLSNVTFMIK
jgi:hypothetical protein